MTEVVIDTNGLLMPFQFDLNLDRELDRVVGDADVYVPSSVKSELEGINEKAALELIKKYRDVEVQQSGDEGVLEAAEELGGVIMTNDKELKKRALDRNIPVAYLRSGTHLELVGEDMVLTEKGSEEETSIILKGEIVSGVGEAKYFLALEGYKKRFREKFGFEPFEGTLNVKVEDRALKKYRRLKEENGRLIEGFVEKGKRFGNVECFPSTIEDTECILILPEKTRYEEQIELVSKHKLRDELDLEDGNEVTVQVRIP